MTGQSFISLAFVFKPYHVKKKKNVKKLNFLCTNTGDLLCSASSRPPIQRQIIISRVFLTDLVIRLLFDIRVNCGTWTDRYNHTRPYGFSNDYFKRNIYVHCRIFSGAFSLSLSLPHGRGDGRTKTRSFTTIRDGK